MCVPIYIDPPDPLVIFELRYRPDVGLLTSEPHKHDVDLNPRIIAPDPLASDDCLDVLSSNHQLLLTTIEDAIMNSEDEPSSGLNGRLRPRKSTLSSPQAAKAVRKPETKPPVERAKRTSTPSKVAPNKLDDLANKSDSPTAPQLLCPYCDKKFASKQSVSKHARRIHFSNAKQDSVIDCLFCNHTESDPNDIISHMVDSHPNQYFACLDCHARFSSTSELAEHKLNVCEKQKEKLYRSKLRQKVSSGTKKSRKAINVVDDKDFTNDSKDFPERFNGVVIACELKPSHVTDEADIEDNITTNLILPPSKNLGTNTVIDKNAVIVLDDIQWNKRMPTNFSFHNTDADQILSRLGVVHRSPRTGESTKKDWFKNVDELVQKFEKCFDTGFYSKVASNVHENMTKFLDGSFNFNPDPDSVIKTRKSKNSVVINTAEGFPILLAYEQYSRSVFDDYMPRTIAPKHKWKWENDKNLLNPDDIKRDTHVNNCIITLVSSLDIWTQLCMRRKFEDKFSIPPLEKKTEKQTTINKELKEILESRELPSSSQQVMKYTSKPIPQGDSIDFPASLGLKPSTPMYDMQPAVLSGEWVRPRCYVCCACGAQTRDSRALSSHISTEHPNAHVQHYEIVGELLLNADILKHLYVPPSQMCNRTRPLRGFRECTKCKKSISLEDLHQHMLDCAGDTPAVRRKCRYRPFGVRRRRPRLPDNTIRKKIRKDIRSRQTRQKTHMRPRPRPKIRSEVGDAETIRKMLADLPAKRHRVMVNPINPMLRPRRKLDKQRNKIIMHRRTSEIAKNRKQREIKKANNLDPAGDDQDNQSDDENKPLKPRLKRVLTHSSRQRESLKRKVALNRAKRRAKIKEQRSSQDNTEQQQQPEDMAASGSSSSDNRGEQLSIGNSPQRIDLGGEPSGIREQSSRGSRSNNRDNRDDQRPGFSGGQNGNLNNSFVPLQNLPLKHSIARLTAETDVHDRSLHYQQFMMQPPEEAEVGVGQHVPSGEQRVFENEAVVTKLDKPPLHCTAGAPIAGNKASKPKKGLDDCITMLRIKNKLEPKPKIVHALGTKNKLELKPKTTHAVGIRNKLEPKPKTIQAVGIKNKLDPKPKSVQAVGIKNKLEPKQKTIQAVGIKNKLEPKPKIVQDVQSGADDPVDDDTVVSNQSPPPVDNQATTTSRPAEVFSRHPDTIPTLIPDRLAEFRNEANLLAQNFSELPFHYLPGQRIGYNLPPSETGIDPRYMTSPMQKQIKGKAKRAAPRRRSARTDKNQDLVAPVPPITSIPAIPPMPTITSMLPITSIPPVTSMPPITSMPPMPPGTTMPPVNYPTSVMTPLNVNPVQGRRSSSQSVTVGAGAVAARRRASVSYNRNAPGKNFNDYCAEIIMAQQRALEYHHPQRISPDTHLLQLNHPETYTQTQINKQNQLIAEQMLLESYISQKKLAICVENNYANQKLAAAYVENMYNNSRRASVSPGNQYDISSRASLSPGNRYENSNYLSVSPGNMYDRLLLSVSPNKHVSVSPGSNNERALVSPGSKYDSRPTTSPGSNHDNSKPVAVSPGSSCESRIHTAVSPGNRFDINKHMIVNVRSCCDNSKQASVSPGSRYDNSKQTIVSPGSLNEIRKFGTLGPENIYEIDKRVTASPGSSYDNNIGIVNSGSQNNNINQLPIRPQSRCENSKNVTISPICGYDLGLQHQSTGNPEIEIEKRHLAKDIPENRSDSSKKISTMVSPEREKVLVSPESSVHNRIVCSESTSENRKHLGDNLESANKTSGPAVTRSGSNYDNAKQAALCSDNISENNKDLKVSVENAYVSTDATSSLNKCDNGRPVAISPENKPNQPTISEQNEPLSESGSNTSKNVIASSGNKNENNKQTDISSGNICKNNQHLTINTKVGYEINKHVTVSPQMLHEISQEAVISPVNRYDTSQCLPVISESSHENSEQVLTVSGVVYDKHLSISPDSQPNKKPNAAIGPANINSKHAFSVAGNKYTCGPTSPGTTYIGKKQAAVAAVAAAAADNNMKIAATSMELNINKKQTAVPDITYDKKQSLISLESIHNTIVDYNTSVTAEIITSPASYVGNTFITKKAQAVAMENKLVNKIQIMPRTESTPITKTNTPSIEGNCVIETHDVNNPERSYDNVHVDSCEGTLTTTNPSDPTYNDSDYDIGDSDDSGANSDGGFSNKRHVTDVRHFNKGVYQSSGNNYYTKKLRNILRERYSTQKKKIPFEYYRRNEYGLKKPVPAAHTSQKPIPKCNVAPLDLSKNPCIEPVEILKDEDSTSMSDSDDNYETLDLSKSSVPEDVVDLRVKIISPNFENTSKLPEVAKLPMVINDRMRNATYLSMKTRKVVISEMNTVPDIPTDLSGKSQEVPLSLTATKLPDNASDRENCVDERLLDLPGHSSANREQSSLENTVNIIHPQDSLLMKAHDEGRTNLQNCIRMSGGECTYMVNTDFHTSPPIAQYEAQNPSMASVNALVDESLRSLKSNSSNFPTVNAIKNVNNFDLGVNSSTSAFNGPVYYPISTTTVPVLAYTLSNTVTERTGSMSQLESTTPVYTLANACISMTKIETSSVPTLSGTISTIPCTTFASVAPLYTLTEASVNSSTNYNSAHNSPTQKLTPALTNPTQSVNDTNDNSTKHISSINSDLPFSVDEQTKKPDKSPHTGTKYMAHKDDYDPETAKKIAMLPKELVEILGTMPVDHRNQLLNVLPQYVSTPVTTSQFATSNASMACSANKGITSNMTTDFDVKPTVGYSPVSSSQIIRPVAAVIPSVEKVDETNSVMQAAVGSESSYDEVKKCEPPEQMPKEYEINGNTVIDLTEDDTPINKGGVKINESINNRVLQTTNETVLIATNNKSNKQKTNDQTASLRAVRIKAPSERNKSISMDNNGLKKSNNEPAKTDVKVVEDQDISLDLDKTLAIQQAEISSTQHNTTIVGNCKYPLAISPSSTDYSGDESTKPVSQQSPISAIEVVTEKVIENKYENPLPKTGMVSSSIPNNVTNLSDVDNNLGDTDLPKVSDLNHESALSMNTDSDNRIEKLNAQNVTGHRNKKNAKLHELHEEDSDDDISLAAIVKQKRDRGVIDNKPLSHDQIEKAISKKRNKSKKYKKVDKKMEIVADVTTSNELKGVDCHAKNEINLGIEPSLHNDKDGYENNDLATQKDIIKNVNHEEGKKHSKKRATKSRRVIDVPNLEENPQVANKADGDTEKDERNKENDKNAELINNKLNIEELTVTGDVITQSCNKDDISYLECDAEISKNKMSQKSNKRVTGDAIVKITKCDDKLSAYADKFLIENKTKEKQKNLEVSEGYEEVLAPNRGELVFEISNLDSGQNVVSASGTSFRHELNSQNKTILKKDCDNTTGPDTDDTKKNKKSIRSKKSKNEDVSKYDQVPENIVQSFDTKENTTTPLRRSKRGKSLFLDGSTLEQETVPVAAPIAETTVEQKAPLTKKQLIFSKLLLDEGNAKPSAHSTPEKQDFNKNEASGSINDDTVDMKQVSDVEHLNEIHPEKSKAMKRRISSQFSKKSKKKKSIEKNSTADEISGIIKKSETAELQNSEEVNSTVTVNKSNDSERITTPEEKCDSINTIAHPLVDNIKTDKEEDKHTVFQTEKRKNNNQISFDLSQSSKPKKCKMTKNDKPAGTSVDIKNYSKAYNILPNAASETKTACYNLPLPARRARSKSVVVKSSTYDPYDIDLEDMIEQSEMFRRNEKCIDHLKKDKLKNLSHKDNNKITKEGRKNNRTVLEEAPKQLQNKVNKDLNSDSDDSTKSDVPLQKYVEEKEKKIQEEEANLSKEKEIKDRASRPQNIQNKVTIKSSLPTTAMDLQKNTQTEAEEELRSEQFMESFGFFSERKPRKSNLLATKKISETFHITNESDDMYFGFKGRSGKKNSNSDNKKSIDTVISKSQPSPSTSKKAAPRRGRRKKAIMTIMPCYCGVCKKEFRRSDNYVRHQMSVPHILKFSEVELKMKMLPVPEEPNHLIAYKQYLERLKKLTDQLAEKKEKHPKAAAKIVLPSHEEILADVNKSVRDQQRRARCLSRDEALFLDCCEQLRESHKGVKQFGLSGLDILEKALNEINTDDNISDDDDCDSITAQNILDSEEVRNLENELISGLKEAANATRNANIEYQQHAFNEFAAPQIIEIESIVQVQELQQVAEGVDHVPCENQVIEVSEKTFETQEAQLEDVSGQFSSPNVADSHSQQMDEFDIPPKPKSVKVKKNVEIKEKMYPDIVIEDIDMFEDKFDKIKRKCRSQAAAAKQLQPVIDKTTSHKSRKKSEKKKKKGTSKKTKHQSTHVPTKGALKGFDGIKVSIPTSEINLSAIVPVSESSSKRKKKSGSRKKRDKRDSESSCKYDSDHRAKDSTAANKKVDVYEFMDNEDAELLELRPSTLMERFKNISNKDLANTSKLNLTAIENSSQGSASDGDDFVYMSDDYVASDDETENSLMSCEMGNGKVSNDTKKNSPHKRKDAVEKSAVMGKIFKHNAVRAEKKVANMKEPEKSKANLDQLFDSLLEEEPNSSMLDSVSDAASSNDDEVLSSRKYEQASAKCDPTDKLCDQTVYREVLANPSKSIAISPGKNDTIRSSSSKRRSPSKEAISSKKHEKVSSKKYDLPDVDYGPSTSKKYDTLDSIDYGPSTSKKYSNPMPKDCKKSLPKSYDSGPIQDNVDNNSFKNNATKGKKRHSSPSFKNDDDLFNSYDDDLKSPANKLDEGISTSYDYSAELYDQSMLEDDTGVARQRARRKCTVGKQNVLSETWSSESEPDGGPPRPNSAESIISGVSRKKKGRKREAQQAGGRRGNNRHVALKKQDVESRVSSSRVSSGVSSGTSSCNVTIVDPGEGTSRMNIVCTEAGVSGGGAIASSANESTAVEAAAAAAMPAPSTSAVAGPSNVKGRPRSGGNFWSSDGDDEQEHLQQHGWIVGDSHKKLVTMLAHAKGRKRNNDDKRHFVE